VGDTGPGPDSSLRVGKDNIRVNAVHPGITETPLACDPSGKPLVPVEKFAISRNVDTEEIARYLLFVASEDAAFSTASEFVADGGYAIGPSVESNRLSKRLRIAS
jgi:3alpha(or 20beta)-hydroxysteroid dehydrogenase